MTEKEKLLAEMLKIQEEFNRLEEEFKGVVSAETAKAVTEVKGIYATLMTKFKARLSTFEVEVCKHCGKHPKDPVEVITPTPTTEPKE